MDRGYDVSVIDLFWFGNHLPKGTTIVAKDIFKLDESDVKGYEQVIFLAGLSNDPMAEFSPSQNFISNAAAPAYLGYISKRAGVRRFIYAGSCSVYGYTVNQLYDENSPAVSNYPYGISKLQGEQAVMQMIDEKFSVICFRQGTVSGYSPRMRLDLVVNTMFKCAVMDNMITVNNPSIWRPILSMQDAVNAYIRAIEANETISGLFNIASGNYTLGEIGDIVKHRIEEDLKMDIGLTIKHVHDPRNYKVSLEKSQKVLSFKPRHDVDSIVHDLIEHKEKFKDFTNPNYYNIQVFKSLRD
ncbi:MAG: SDR family oxidoreductase [Ignavibacteriae bacterium]|nr:SDR family oxidoreductase [Ignavibacteriota bacterium]